MFSRIFWRDAAERAITTAAQGALLALGGDLLDVLQADWRVVGGAAASGALLALLKAVIAARTVGSPHSASLDPEARPAIGR